MYGKVHNNITYNGLQTITSEKVPVDSTKAIRIDGNKTIKLESNGALIFELKDGEETSIDFQIDKSESGEIVTKDMIKNVVRFEDISLKDKEQKDLSNGELRVGNDTYKIAKFDDYLKSDTIELTSDDNGKISKLSIHDANDSAEVVLLKNLQKEVENLQFSVNNTNATTNLITEIKYLRDLQVQVNDLKGQIEELKSEIEALQNNSQNTEEE